MTWAELVERTRFSRKCEHPVALVDERTLLRHEVEPVPHRVHQQHVIAGEGRERPGVVILDVEHDRRPIRCSPAFVDARHRGLDLVLVGEVLGQSLARRVGERDEDHSTTTVRLALEELVEGPESAEEVLRELHAVDSDHDLAVGVADPFVDPQGRFRHRGVRGRLGELFGVDGQR